MAWRVLQVGNERWKVSPAAERRANTPVWYLVLSFRATGDRASAVWATYPIESASKAVLFQQAERIPDDQLAALLTERLNGAPA